MIANQTNIFICTVAMVAFSTQPSVATTALQVNYNLNPVCLPYIFKGNGQPNGSFDFDGNQNPMGLMTVSNNVDNAEVYVGPQKNIVKIKVRFKITQKTTHRIFID